MNFIKALKVNLKIHFNVDFNDEWENFIAFEKEFQNKNIAKLKNSEITPLKILTNQPLGWISEPYIDKSGNNIFLATIIRIIWQELPSLI